MKTTYFNITEKLARSPPSPSPFFSPNEIVAIKFTCTQNIETLHRGNLKKIVNSPLFLKVGQKRSTN